MRNIRSRMRGTQVELHMYNFRRFSGPAASLTASVGVLEYVQHGLWNHQSRCSIPHHTWKDLSRLLEGNIVSTAAIHSWLNYGMLPLEIKTDNHSFLLSLTMRPPLCLLSFIVLLIVEPKWVVFCKDVGWALSWLTFWLLPGSLVRMSHQFYHLFVSCVANISVVSKLQHAKKDIGDHHDFDDEGFRNQVAYMTFWRQNIVLSHDLWVGRNNISESHKVRVLLIENLRVFVGTDRWNMAFSTKHLFQVWRKQHQFE